MTRKKGRKGKREGGKEEETTIVFVLAFVGQGWDLMENKGTEEPG